jgi:hypothetical protein
MVQICWWCHIKVEVIVESEYVWGHINAGVDYSDRYTKVEVIQQSEYVLGHVSGHVD